MTEGRWWYLDLAADFPELEIYTGPGWGPEQELGQYELGERVMEEETLWLFTWLYSDPRARHWAAVSRMAGMIVAKIRRERSEGEKILRVLAGEDPDRVDIEEMPEGWMPDVEAWDEGRL